MRVVLVKVPPRRSSLTATSLRPIWWKARDRARSTRWAPRCSTDCSCGRFPEGEPKADIDLSLHYVLAHRHDQPVAAGYTPRGVQKPLHHNERSGPSRLSRLRQCCKGPAPERSPGMGYQITPCTECVLGPRQSSFASLMARHGSSFMRGAIPAHLSGNRSRQDGCSGPVRLEHHDKWTPSYTQYTAWSDGDNHLSGAGGSLFYDRFGVAHNNNIGPQIESYLRQQKSCLQLHGMICWHRPRLLHLVIHPDA